MGLDWDKLNTTQAKLEEALTRGGGPRISFWRPSPGKNQIRIMPAWTKEGFFADQFWREVGQHWGVSESRKGPILCPKNTPGLSGECPVCDYVAELRADKGSKEAQQRAKDLRFSRAYFLNIVDLDDPEYTAKDVASFKENSPTDDPPFEVGDTKVQIYACPPTVFQEIVSYVKLNELDITDPAKGNNVIIQKTGKGLTTKYNVTVLAKPCEAPEGGVLAKLSDIGVTMDAAEMKNLLAEGQMAAGLSLSSGSDNDSASSAAAEEDQVAALQAKLAALQS